MLVYFCIQKSYTNPEEECETHRDGEINEGAHWKATFPGNSTSLLLHLSGERSPSFPRPFIPNIEDWKTSQTCKVVYSGIWHHANRLRAINFIIIPLTFVLIHSSHAKKTFPTVCCLDMKQISPDWSVSGFLGQSDSSGWFWCDVMRWDVILSSSTALSDASLSVARLPRLLWRTSLPNNSREYAL